MAKQVLTYQRLLGDTLIDRDAGRKSLRYHPTVIFEACTSSGKEEDYVSEYAWKGRATSWICLQRVSGLKSSVSIVASKQQKLQSDPQD